MLIICECYHMSQRACHHVMFNCSGTKLQKVEHKTKKLVSFFVEMLACLLKL